MRMVMKYEDDDSDMINDEHDAYMIVDEHDVYMINDEHDAYMIVDEYDAYMIVEHDAFVMMDSLLDDNVITISSTCMLVSTS